MKLFFFSEQSYKRKCVIKNIIIVVTLNKILYFLVFLIILKVILNSFNVIIMLLNSFSKLIFIGLIIMNIMAFFEKLVNNINIFAFHFAFISSNFNQRIYPFQKHFNLQLTICVNLNILSIKVLLFDILSNSLQYIDVFIFVFFLLIFIYYFLIIF